MNDRRLILVPGMMSGVLWIAWGFPIAAFLGQIFIVKHPPGPGELEGLGWQFLVATGLLGAVRSFEGIRVHLMGAYASPFLAPKSAPCDTADLHAADVRAASALRAAAGSAREPTAVPPPAPAARAADPSRAVRVPAASVTGGAAAIELDRELPAAGRRKG